MKTERLERGINARAIQQRGDGVSGVSIEDNRQKGSRNYLSGAPLQQLETNARGENIMQCKNDLNYFARNNGVASYDHVIQRAPREYVHIVLKARVGSLFKEGSRPDIVGMLNQYGLLNLEELLNKEALLLPENEGGKVEFEDSIREQIEALKSETEAHSKRVFMWDDSEKGLRGAQDLANEGDTIRIRIRYPVLSPFRSFRKMSEDMKGSGAWSFKGSIPRNYIHIEGVDPIAGDAYERWKSGKGWN